MTIPSTPAEPGPVASTEDTVTDLRRQIARLELELDRRAQEVADLHSLLRRLTVPAAEAPSVGRRNAGVMVVVMIIAPAVIVLLVVLLAVIQR